jgi:hypothetical protein
MRGRREHGRLHAHPPGQHRGPGGDHAGVVQLAAAACRTPSPVDPKLIALALQQQARGHAWLGEHRYCFTLLDRAAEALREHPDVTGEDAPVYLHHYDLCTLTEQSAACY